jgi:hypothetical protein
VLLAAIGEIGGERHLVVRPNIRIPLLGRVCVDPSGKVLLIDPYYCTAGGALRPIKPAKGCRITGIRPIPDEDFSLASLSVQPPPISEGG